jgi:putative ABC transport system ATP-binding protein
MSTTESLTAVVRLDNVSKVFNSSERGTIAVQAVTLEARRGELLLLLGPSGSGKTTLLALAAGLLKPTSGRVLLFGRKIERYSATELQDLRANQVGFIFQTFLLIESLTLSENVEVVLRFTRKSKKEARRRAHSLLKLFHIDHLAQKFPSSLSQGEKQRVAIARAIANGAGLILADEPTGSLESKQGFDIIRLLHDYAKFEQGCVIVASHDLRLVDCADRVVTMEDGKLSAVCGRGFS